MIRLMVMIVVFGCILLRAERPGLSENKWLLGFGNQGLSLADRWHYPIHKACLHRLGGWMLS